MPPTNERLPVALDVELETGDVARANLTWSRLRSPVRFWIFTLFGLLLVASLVFWTLFGVREPGFFTNGRWVMLAFGGLYAAFVLPWTRHRIVARLTRWTSPIVFAPYRIVAFGPGSMDVVSATGTSTLGFATFDQRFETPFSFVLAKEGAPLAMPIPKRVFPSESSIAAFRAAFVADASVHAAFRAFASPPNERAIRYLLTVDEFRRGMALLFANSPWRFARPLLYLALVGYGVYFAAKADDPEIVLPYLAVAGLHLGFVFVLARRKTLARVGGQLVDTTLELTDAGFRVESAQAMVDVRWDTCVGLLEDDEILVLSHATSCGFVVPKRSIPDEVQEAIRAALPRLSP